MSIYTEHLQKFVIESWRIEGLPIAKADLDELVRHHGNAITETKLTVANLAYLADKFTKGYGRIRDKPGMDVQVGNHVPMRGGPLVEEHLSAICDLAYETGPYELHQLFENLHPFIDGNGRTGRVVWLWRMEQTKQRWQLGFLHTWYYQSLQNWKPDA